MSTYFLIAFFILFGIMDLVSTSIPHWALGALALATALALIIGTAPWKKP
jgi:hypothetical protein